uniref:Tubulin-specific chaperone E n=1 Tax=Panagrolaimus sp. ES5 TaxID=591445 RepID=A0AC34FVF3_9BILA
MEQSHHHHILPIDSFIMHNGDRGYIRYYGEVKGYDGFWYGIEWEPHNTKRGKHNGTVKGIKYFESKNPKGASFIRASENISNGEDIVTLIAQRYAESAVKYKASVNKIDIELEEESYATNDDQSGKPEDNLSKVYAITLDRYPLAFCKSLEKTFPACKDLVISYTLLTKWSDIFKILQLFPNLRHLDISNNLLENLSDLRNLENVVIKNPIRTLKVNLCNMDDESVYRLLLIFPEVVELHLTGNLLKSVSIPSHYSTLEILYLQDNDIITFNNLRSLGSLPKLKYLNVSNCKISKITVDEPFAALEKLVAAENKFSHWDDIMELNKFTNLKQVVLNARLPVPKGMDPREVMVVKFPNITELDRLDISPVFRRNCEYDFMNKISSLNPIPSYFKVDIQRLQKIYPDFVVEIPEPQTEVLDKETIKLRFIYGETTFEKIFDSTQEFSQIIKIVCRKMKVPTRGIEVYIRRYQENFNGYGETEEHVKYLSSNIKSYDLDSNSTVVLKVSD